VGLFRVWQQPDVIMAVMAHPHLPIISSSMVIVPCHPRFPLMNRILGAA
jgi:hypothetical protein